MRRGLAAVAGIAALLLALTGSGRAQVETPRLTVAVGGQALYIYLPLTLAQQLGYFKDAGVDVDIVDVAGGARALEALLGGSASVVCGFIDHTIEMQAQGKSIRMFVLYDRYPGLVLAVTKAGQAKGITTIADLRASYLENYNFQNPLSQGFSMSTINAAYGAIQAGSEGQEGLLPGLGIQGYGVGAELSQLYWNNTVWASRSWGR